MTGHYNFRRSFFHNVIHYRATNEPRYMWDNEHQAITNVIAMRSALKLTLGIIVILIMWSIRNV